MTDLSNIPNKLAELSKSMPADQVIWANSKLTWLKKARPKQIVPDRWRKKQAVNLFWCTGRGFGKTRSAAEACWDYCFSNPHVRVGVIAPTFADVKKICFEGESGLLGCCPPELIVSYNKANLEIEFKNGSKIYGYSSETPDRLRGVQHHMIWGEEVSSWVYPQDTWDMSAFGLRLGDYPQRLLTSTPKPIPLIRDLINDENTIVIRGSSYDNKENLPESFFEEISKYEGTELGRQEILGEVIDLEEKGIFKRSWFRIWPHDKALPKFDLVVQSWDTAFSEKSSADYTAFSAWGVWKATEGSSVYSSMLLDFWQAQIGFPEMRRAAMREYETKYGENERAVDMVVIEKKASGQSLIQELRQSGIYVKDFEPGAIDKVQRAHLISHIVKDGLVWLPESSRRDRRGMPCDWASELLEQACYFPNVKNDDAVDSMVQFLTVMSKTRMMRSSSLPPKESYWKKTMRPSGVNGVYG